MFERFTDRARRVVVLAQEEAVLLNHDYIGTEHILLGVVHEGAAADVLAKLAAPPDAVRAQVRSLLEAGPAPTGAPPVCSRCGATLTDALTTTEVQVLEHGSDGRLAVTFARCIRCGAVVGLFSGGT